MISFTEGEQNFKGECQKGEIGIGPLWPDGWYSILPNFKFVFYIHP